MPKGPNTILVSGPRTARLGLVAQGGVRGPQILSTDLVDVQSLGWPQKLAQTRANLLTGGTQNGTGVVDYLRWVTLSLVSRILSFYSTDQGGWSILGWLRVWWLFLLASESLGVDGLVYFLCLRFSKYRSWPGPTCWSFASF